MMTRLCTVCVLVASVAFAQGTTARSQRAGRVLRPSALIHVVANLDRSVAFYREAVGLEFSSPPAPLTGSALLQLVGNASPRAQGRAASFTIPGAEMELTLIEFTGAKQAPLSQRRYDPGVASVSLQVRDAYALFLSVWNHGVTIDTTGGRPMRTQLPDNNTMAVTLRDPDGFPLGFVEPDPRPETRVAANSNIFNAAASLTVEDTERSLAFYRDLLGFASGPTDTVSSTILRLEGTPGAMSRATPATPPGSTNPWFLWEFSAIDRTRRAPNPQDPGAAALSLLVEDLAELLDRLKAAGVRVETASGAPVVLGQGLRGAVVRSPDGLLIELIEPTD